MNTLTEDQLTPQPVKIVECVPYQLCPKCNGTGLTYYYTAINKCDVCNGSKIIPMHVVSVKK